MAALKVGIYHKWLGSVPEDEHGEPLPKSMWVKNRRHKWIVRWVGTNGKKYGKVFGKRKEADRFSMELQDKVLSGTADKPKKISLYEFRVEHESIIKGQVAYGTYQEHKCVLKLFEKFIGGSIELTKITPGRAEAFFSHCINSGEISIATVNKYLRTLKGIFNKAIEPRRYLSKGQNPFESIKPRKITENDKRYLNIKEYCQLLGATDDIWWKAFISVAYSSGLRLNEILHLTWKDIDFEHKRVRVSAKKATKRIIKWEPKGRKKRIVPISDEALKFLVDIQVDAPDGHPYIFISPNRLHRIFERMKACKWHDRSEVINNMNKNFKTIRIKSGIEECTIHDLRRSAITNWTKKLPFQVVHKLAGHVSIKTTMDYYMAVRPEDFDSANEVFSEMLEGVKL
ncbi:MAG: tyrosine-type recombinase/integrase [Phycisphaerae bacterium]|nr:tyrosine-type recombinase/integrase [Phycisphaerae bacterium]